MPGSLQYRLLQFGTPPPPEAWNNIRLQLDGAANADEVIQQKLYAAEIMAPASAWQTISKSIAPNAPEKRTPIIPLFYRRLSVAVMVTAVIGLGVLYFMNGSQKKNAAPPLAKQEMTSLPPKSAETRQAPLKPVELSPLPVTVTAPKKNLLASSRQANKIIPARNITPKDE
ncbi:MAG: hypothetical protein ABI687_01375, partial [Flavitalea sp.]